MIKNREKGILGEYQNTKNAVQKKSFKKSSERR